MIASGLKRAAHNMVLQPTQLVVTPFAYVKAAPPAVGGLTKRYMKAMTESFQSKVTVVPEETFGMPRTIAGGPQKLEIVIGNEGMEIGNVFVKYDDIQNSALRSVKSLFGKVIMLRLSDGINNYFIEIPDDEAAQSLPFEILESKTSKWGLIGYILLIILLLVQVYRYLST